MLKTANKDKFSLESEEWRSRAIVRLKSLLTDAVDWSNIGRIDFQVECLGLHCPQVSRYAKKDPEYCLGHWDYSRGAWCGRKCHYRAHLDAETAKILGWRQVSEGILQCPACFIAKSHICRQKEAIY